jgi:hypothetical protein
MIRETRDSLIPTSVPQVKQLTINATDAKMVVRIWRFLILEKIVFKKSQFRTLHCP